MKKQSTKIKLSFIQIVDHGLSMKSYNGILMTKNLALLLLLNLMFKQKNAYQHTMFMQRKYKTPCLEDVRLVRQRFQPGNRGDIPLGSGPCDLWETPSSLISDKHYSLQNAYRTG